jgi:L-methionine (R)-S-oxide reductase
MTTSQPSTSGPLQEIQHLVDTAPDATAALDRAMAYLHATRKDYHWVGIYRLVGDVLELGPYRGPTTDHARIPVGRGVCGTAVAENRNQVVGDVRALSNYLACNLETRSEMVILIRHPETSAILGQIDIDGTQLNQFSSEEEQFISEVAATLARPLMTLSHTHQA